MSMKQRVEIAKKFKALSVGEINMLIGMELDYDTNAKELHKILVGGNR
ncbi:MAG: hypothetical protein ACRDDH_05775 [Cetobacterium sp.]